MYLFVCAVIAERSHARQNSATVAKDTRRRHSRRFSQLSWLRVSTIPPSQLFQLANIIACKDRKERNFFDGVGTGLPRDRPRSGIHIIPPLPADELAASASESCAHFLLQESRVFPGSWLLPFSPRQPLRLTYGSSAFCVRPFLYHHLRIIYQRHISTLALYIFGCLDARSSPADQASGKTALPRKHTPTSLDVHKHPQDRTGKQR